MTGEHLAPDVKELLRLLHEHRVRYLVVGGEAVIHHGYPRLTGDVDLFYDRAPRNARRLFAALEEYWNGSVPAVTDASELEEERLVVQFGRPPNRVDFLSDLGSVAFARAYRRRVVERLRVGRRSIELPIIGLEDLIVAKRDAGRYKDLDDIEHLRAVSRPKRRRAR